MIKTYRITDAKFTQAKNLIRQNGGITNPDNSFEIFGVEGSFERGGDSLTINVTKKPLFATWKKIERELDEFFSES